MDRFEIPPPLVNRIAAAFATTALALILARPGFAQHQHTGSPMRMTPQGVVMNENTDRLPRDCQRISGDLSFTIHAGRKYADEPGMIFGMSQNKLQVPPCSRVTVTYVNEDEVRHQWMLHGLPNYLYPAGMFHLEASAGKSMTGTFIVPSDNRTYVIHCDIAQHMEKGMRAELVVGSGSGDLWGVPHVSRDFRRADYAPRYRTLGLLVSLLAGFIATIFLLRRFQEK